MENQLFWLQGDQTVRPVLRGRCSADAVVIGGGFAGLNIALWLCKAGLRVVLLEAETLGSGASSRCLGKVSLLGGVSYAQLERRHGSEVSAAYGLSQQNAFAALSVAHYAYILEVGRDVLEGPGRELLENPKVKDAYLGG
jgi:glycine/D-amino acid oxidase-like deaminating enzyme